jgi:hypothetical protein
MEVLATQKMITYHQVKQTSCSFTRESRHNEPVNEQTTEAHPGHPFATLQSGDAGSVHCGPVQYAHHMGTRFAEVDEYASADKSQPGSVLAHSLLFWLQVLPNYYRKIGAGK